MARIVEVLPYDPTWPQIYHGEVVQVASVLGSNLVAPHHIGSTAVPGLAAKPTIDILLVVRDLQILDDANTALAALGYQAMGEHGISGWRYFSKKEGDRHLFHLHTYAEGHADIIRHLNFRDYLIAHPSEVFDYQTLKQSLATQFRDRPAAYTAGKADFIHAVEKRAAAWRAGLDQDIG
ncbi:MAG: GrpB family protein [Brevefilum sp.]|nr:GrpB family protein [Brevefilum sp.]